MEETDATTPLRPRTPAGSVTASQMAQLLSAGAEAFPQSLSPSLLRHWEPPSVESLRQALPQYQITTLIGRGGMGAVYRGTQTLLNRPVAIKILPPEMLAADSHFADRFKLEARSMARLSHPHIVAVFDAGETADNLLYIVMEFVEGIDLGQRLSETAPLEPTQALEITASVCRALIFAHEMGIIHRDIKPSNIMLDSHGLVKVADFGLAKALDPESSNLTSSGLVMGTPNYTAPESRLLHLQVDARADIYSTGVLIYQMLTGQLPIGRFSLPSKLIPALDPQVDTIVDRCLQSDRNLRYPDARQLEREITALLQKRCQKRTRRFPRKVVILAAPLAILLPAALWFFNQPVSISSTPPATVPKEEGWYRTFPKGQWASVRASLADSESLAVDPAGWMRLPHWVAFTPSNARGTNWAVRATFKGDHEDRVPELLLREDGTQNFNAYLDNGGRSLTVQQCTNQGGRTYYSLANLTLRQPIVKGTPYTLEFYAIGSRLIARLNGETLDFLIEDPPRSGRASVYGIKFDAYRDVQHLNLDGLPESEALKLAGVTATTPPPQLARRPVRGVPETSSPTQITSTSSPPSTSTLYPPGVWTRLDPQFASHSTIATNADGWFQGRPPATVLPTSVKGKNWGIRATFKSQVDISPELILRSSVQANFNAYLESGGRTLTIQRYDSTAANRYQTLIRKRLSHALPKDSAYTIEFYAIGPHLIARIGDESVSTIFDTPHTEGRGSIYGIQTASFRHVEVINLEAFPIEEALNIVGILLPKAGP